MITLLKASSMFKQLYIQIEQPYHSCPFNNSILQTQNKALHHNIVSQGLREYNS